MNVYQVIKNLIVVQSYTTCFISPHIPLPIRHLIYSRSLPYTRHLSVKVLSFKSFPLKLHPSLQNLHIPNQFSIFTPGEITTKTESSPIKNTPFAPYERVKKHYLIL